MKEFEIITTCKMSENKELVASYNSNGDIAIAKRFVVIDNGEPKYFYEKGALIVPKDEFKNFIEKISEKMLTE